jgi:hypothetical protein
VPERISVMQELSNNSKEKYWKENISSGNSRPSKTSIGGDCNTQYFLSWANHRRKLNGIRQISDGDMRILRKNHDISRVFTTYYEK